MTRADFDMERDMGLNFTKGDWILSDEGTLAQAQVKYRQLWARLSGLGFSTAQFMQLNVFPAVWNELVLRGQGGGQPITGRVTSNNGITAPSGIYQVNFPCIMDGGIYLGKGTGYAGTTALTSMNTTLELNRAGWLGDVGTDPYDVMMLMVTSTWGITSGATSYTESGYVDGFRLIGDNSGWYDVSYTCHGLALWDIGETWKVGRIYAEQFNGYGIACVRGTPACLDYASVFVNALGGIGLIGTDQNSININMLSGDDNPALIVQIDGYGRVAGGNLNVNLGKIESNLRSPEKGQIIIWQRSPCSGLITVKGQDTIHAGGGKLVDAMFVMNTLNPSAGQLLHADFIASGYKTMVHDITNSKRWAGTDYRPHSIVWSSKAANGGVLVDSSVPAAVASTAVNATDRLGQVLIGNVFDYVLGTPAYSITGP